MVSSGIVGTVGRVALHHPSARYQKSNSLTADAYVQNPARRKRRAIATSAGEVNELLIRDGMPTRIFANCRNVQPS
jgi:hypothetical protein